jgi:hypothetical protein
MPDQPRALSNTGTFAAVDSMIGIPVAAVTQAAPADDLHRFFPNFQVGWVLGCASPMRLPFRHQPSKGSARKDSNLQTPGCLQRERAPGTFDRELTRSTTWSGCSGGHIDAGLA